MHSEARSGAALHSYLYLGSKKGNFVKLRVSHGAADRHH